MKKKYKSQLQNFRKGERTQKKRKRIISEMNIKLEGHK